MKGLFSFVAVMCLTIVQVHSSTFGKCPELQDPVGEEPRWGSTVTAGYYEVEEGEEELLVRTVCDGSQGWLLTDYRFRELRCSYHAELAEWRWDIQHRDSGNVPQARCSHVAPLPLQQLYDLPDYTDCSDPQTSAAVVASVQQAVEAALPCQAQGTCVVSKVSCKKEDASSYVVVVVKATALDSLENQRHLLQLAAAVLKFRYIQISSDGVTVELIQAPRLYLGNDFDNDNPDNSTGTCEAWEVYNKAGNGSCLECNAGMYANKANSSSEFCEYCGYDTYKYNATHVNCTACGNGKGTLDEGSTSLDNCTAPCARPSLADGTVSPSTETILPGEVYTVTCDAGFVMSGDPTMECGDDGSLSATTCAGWTDVTLGQKIEYDLEEHPLQIMTNASLGTDEKVHVIVYPADGDIYAYFYLDFLLEEYYIRDCSSRATSFPVPLPEEEEKVWTIRKDERALAIECNGVEVLEYVFSEGWEFVDGNRDECVAQWGQEVGWIEFSTFGDTASNQYRREPSAAPTDGGDEKWNDDFDVDVLLIVIIFIAVAHATITMLLFLVLCCCRSRAVHPKPVTPAPLEDGIMDEDSLRLRRIRELDGYLTVAIETRDMAELKLAIHMVEKEEFQRVLDKKYRDAQDLFQELMGREDAEKKREIEEAEGQPALAKKELEEAEAEARRRQAEEQDATRAREAIRARDAAKARWGRAWPRLQILKALKELNATAIEKAMEDARNQKEEEERLRRKSEEKAKLVKYCKELLQHGIDTQDEGKLETAIKNTHDRNLQEDEAVTELFQKAQTELEKLREERIRREAEEEAKRQAALAEEEAKRQAALAEEEAKRQAALAEEEAKRQTDLAEEEAKRKAADGKRLASLAELNKIQDALRAAIKERDIGKLKKCLLEAEDKHLEEDLKPDYETGKRLLERLEKMEIVKRKIMDLDRPLIAELKSFSEPPVPVYRAMMASYLLMGESKSSLKEWSNIVILLNKTGKLSVKRRVQELKLENVSEETAQAAEKQIVGLTSQEVYEANQAASLFFDWTEMICYERKHLEESTD